MNESNYSTSQYTASVTLSLSQYFRTASFWLTVGLLAAVVLGSVFANFVAPYSPDAIDLMQARQPPSWGHWFGTDMLGRDVFSRTLYGGQVSLFITFTAVGLAGLSGTLIGILSAYFGGWVDNLVMRIVDMQYALPPVILAMVLIGVLGPSTTNVIAVVTIANWARFARIVRAETLSLKHRDFVLLARLAGASPLRIALTHLLPNVKQTFVVLLILDVGMIISLEAALSFLGLGVQPPTPSWGSMIADGRGQLETAWWVSIFPGTVLMLTVLCANLLSDHLRRERMPEATHD